VVALICPDLPFPSALLPCVYTYKRYENELAKTYITEKQGYLLPLHSHERVDCFRQDPFKKVSAFPSSV